MWNAALWGAVSGSAVLLGSLAAMIFSIPKKVIGWVMAFGTGVLIGAASYELLGDAVQEGGILASSIGFVAGASIFTLLDILVSRKGASDRKRSGKQADENAGIAIFIGTIMDAIPESIMIGASLLEQNTVSFLLVIAIFVSNIPEGLSSTAGLRKSGYSRLKISVMWISVLVIATLSSWSGYFFLQDASEALMAGISGFAGGGIIAMIASTMMPEAYEESGPVTGLITALGLLASLVLHHLS
ncbi:ZIP family metal transporter [Bacillus sp. ISL-35]|uniref:ZIP family metal transporter n=1 Tax=Bacillus sp. ISL-35 TaxID=2819122 RepID=UPI001BE745EC|nr:hypothetical protein [Bacillus sp. ISL-35]MBT2680427.1 ZIP family metal transporter [Bacillus sp. ISL-35]MBT2704281.1 hypothetical protein [Chryseobacterium sp. ISL-80]